MKAKEDERLAAIVAATAKKEMNKDKKARETTVLMTKGSNLLLRIEQLGSSVLDAPKVDELHALLVNANLQGIVPKPNKTVGLEKVRSLSTVSAAI